MAAVANGLLPPRRSIRLHLAKLSTNAATTNRSGGVRDGAEDPLRREWRPVDIGAAPCPARMGSATRSQADVL